MTYARWWRAGWSLITTLGLGLAVLQMSGGALFAVALLAATVAVVLAVARTSHGRPPGPDRTGARGVVERAVLWSALLLATCTVVDDSPPVALLLALVAVTTCPPATRLYRTALRPPAAGRDVGEREGAANPIAPGSSVLDDATPMVRRLSEADLCELWRSTFWELHEQHTADERLTLVTLRQICLDELARRDPQGLQAWLSSGARASSSPDRFLHPPEHGTPDAA